VPFRATIALLVGALLGLGGAACEIRDPCGKLAERDCAEHGESSLICKDARQRAASADPFLTEVCRRELEGGRTPR
jgi:hypothetical protein